MSSIVVTGASRGIGRAIAEALLARGDRVVGVARDEARLRALADAHPRFVPFAGDVRDEAVATAAVAQGAAELDLAAVVHAAGVADYEHLGHAPVAALHRAMAIACDAAWVLGQAALRVWRREGRGGALVFVASNLAERPIAGLAAYSASKAALVSLSRSFALEGGPDGVRSNALLPGAVDTDMVRQVRVAPNATALAGRSPEAQVEAQLDATRAQIPLRRLGQPEEIAQAALYLIDAPFVSGTSLVIDGGVLAG